VPAGGKAGDPWSSWLNPTAILGGILAVVVCAYLAAVYLVWDARRLDEDDMVEYFRRRRSAPRSRPGSSRSSASSCCTTYAHYVFDGLMSRGLALVILSAICGIGSLTLLLRGQHSVARILAMGAVATIIVGWGVAQYPYILPTSLTLSAAAAPDPTLWSVVVVFVVAAIVILPSLGCCTCSTSAICCTPPPNPATDRSGRRGVVALGRRHLGRCGRGRVRNDGRLAGAQAAHEHRDDRHQVELPGHGLDHRERTPEIARGGEVPVADRRLVMKLK